MVKSKVSNWTIQNAKSGRSDNIKKTDRFLRTKCLPRRIVHDSQFREARNRARSHDRICVVNSNSGMIVEGSVHVG